MVLDSSVHNSDLTHQTIAYLRSTTAIRERCGLLFEFACQDRLQHFRCDLQQIDRVADYVLAVMRSAYPELQIPFHSRWRHFEAGGIDRLSLLEQKLAGLSAIEQAKAKFDLAITSVLLDAGAGATWRYLESETGQVFGRSEGLAVASFHLFLQGGFSSDPNYPFQADAKGLQQITKATLCQGFQVSEQNPLVGVEGRLQLMQRLGQVLQDTPDLFGQSTPRPGNLVDYLIQKSQIPSQSLFQTSFQNSFQNLSQNNSQDNPQNRPQNNQLTAHTVFEAVLQGFSEIWSGRMTLDGVNLGDVWTHTALPDRGLGSQLVPFHKLSQWLTYSLLEPLQDLGLHIIDLDQLTGLAEYRNGGLCIDLGVLQPKHEGVTNQPHQPGSEVIVEWRALTIVLLDRIAEAIRRKLGIDAVALPLAKVLEGGTWAAGRKIAAEKRSGGVPPIQIISDGTVF